MSDDPTHNLHSSDSNSQPEPPEPNEALTDHSQMMEKAQAVHARYGAIIMSVKHVVGIGIGYAMRDGMMTDEVALVVMVDQKHPPDSISPLDVLPDQLDGVRVDVQEVGTFSAGFSAGL